MKISVNDRVDIFCSLKSTPIVSRAIGRVNCISPVRAKGIFPVAKENISKGMIEINPASQISPLDRSESSPGKMMGKSNSQMTSAKPAVRKVVSRNKPFTASTGVAFFRYVYEPQVVAINK